jgi:hypothetical protein
MHFRQKIGAEIPPLQRDKVVRARLVERRVRARRSAGGDTPPDMGGRSWPVMARWRQPDAGAGRKVPCLAGSS